MPIHEASEESAPRDRAEPLVVCRGVRRVYGSGRGTNVALDGVDLTISRGEFVTLVGPSGSGKSTLLHLIGAMDRPDAGEVRVAGRDLARLDDGEASRFRREEIGFVFQFFNLIPTLSALDNVALPSRLSGIAVAAARARAQELLDRVGIGHRKDDPPDTLSGGQQQRVAIARALVNQPSLVLADEPTGALDRRSGEQVLDLLGAIARERRATLLVVTHSDTAIEFADRVIGIEDGRIASPAAGAKP